MRMLVPEAGRVDPPLEDVYAWPEGRCLRVNFVASVDGAATLEGRSGGLSSPIDKEVFFHLRATSDVVLVGAGTARNEHYGPAKVPIAVVTNRLSLHVDDRLFSGGEGKARPIVFVPASVERSRRDALAEVADVVEVGEEEVDLRLVVSELESRGMRRILCEGGPTLFGDLIDLQLVDELCLTIAPTLVAGDSPRVAHGGHPSAPLPTRLLTALEDSGELLLRYAVG